MERLFIVYERDCKETHGLGAVCNLDSDLLEFPGSPRQQSSPLPKTTSDSVCLFLMLSGASRGNLSDWQCVIELVRPPIVKAQREADPHTGTEL